MPAERIAALRIAGGGKRPSGPELNSPSFILAQTPVVQKGTAGGTFYQPGLVFVPARMTPPPGACNLPTHTPSIGRLLYGGCIHHSREYHIRGVWGQVLYPKIWMIGSTRFLLGNMFRATLPVRRNVLTLLLAFS